MKIFFANRKCTELADDESRMLLQIKPRLLRRHQVSEVSSPDCADVILLQEKFSYKDFRYIDRLLCDPMVSKYTEKIFTINCDDCATGLLRGVYTSLPMSRFSAGIHAAVPYMEYPNELVFSNGHKSHAPSYLASWRGNTKSNAIRMNMISALKSDPAFCLETTDSWLNHQVDEKRTYVELMLSARFSLCPAGWAPVSFRIYESMALGRCPVILADDFVPPSGVNWRECALFYPEKKIAGLPAFLREHEHLHEELGTCALRVWNTAFAPGVVEDYVARVLVTLIESARSTTQSIEVKRWRSSRLYWSNKWTFPQRIMNKARRLSRAIVAN